MRRGSIEAACLRLLTLAAPLVPRWRRDDWRREWQAELWTAVHRPRRLRAASGPALFGRTAGALVHALWLRQRDWMLDMLKQDVTYGLRMLRNTPAFTAVAILTLALGIGATTAMFSVVNTALLHPLPFADPDRLVQLWESNEERGWVHETCAPANYHDWKRDAASFSAMSAYIGSDTKDAGLTNLALTGLGDAERIQGVRVAVDFFDALGVRPALGRGFAGEQEWSGDERVVVLSHAFWTRRFGGDPSIVGRTIVLDGVPREVRGVMPASFTFPRADLDVWLPFIWKTSDVPNLRRPHFIRVFARLQPGVTVGEAQAELTAIAGRLERDFPETNRLMRAGVGPLHEWTVGDQRAGLLWFFGVVGFVLLISCTNIANLVLARTLDRQREIAIRLALGATRVRVVRQVLTECFVLAAAGGAAGTAVADALVRTLVSVAPPGVPRLDEVHLDATALVFALLASTFAAVLIGTLPAFHGSANRFGEWLKPTGRRGSSGASTPMRARGLLVAGEVALSVVLLLGAGLLSRSLLATLRIDPGFDSHNVLTFEIALPRSAYPTPEGVVQAHDAIRDRIRRLPGVIAVGATRKLPATGHSWSSDFSIRGRAPDDFGIDVRHREVTSTFFDTMRTPIVKGRGFTDADRPSLVAIVNEALARRYFAEQDPIGQQINFDRPGGTSPWRTIVGVVADQKQDGLQHAVQPEIYEPQFQSAQRALAYVVRTASDPLAIAGGVRAAVREVDPGVPVARISTLDEVIGRITETQRLASLLVVGFAATGLLLAALGIYGVLSYQASRMLGEIGIRVALGAQRADIVRLVTARGVWTVGGGLIAGVVVALALARMASAFLYGVSPTDPLSYGVVIALLAVVAAAASAAPVHRATRVEPAAALRME